MKKILITTLTAVLMLSACGGESDNSNAHTETVAPDEFKISNVYINDDFGLEFNYSTGLIERDNAFWTAENYKIRYEEKGTMNISYPEFAFKVAEGKGVDELIMDSLAPGMKEDYKDYLEEAKFANNEFQAISNEHFDSFGCNYFMEIQKGAIRISTVHNCGESEIVKEVLASLLLKK